MWGTTSRTSSPERVTMRRSTPWVEGCCGPTFRVITSVRSSLASSGGRLGDFLQELFLIL